MATKTKTPASGAAQPTEAERDLQNALADLNDFDAQCEKYEYTDTGAFWTIARALNTAATKVLQERGVSAPEPKVNRAQ